MNGTYARWFRLVTGFFGLVTLGSVIIGQTAKPSPEGMPTDWSHRHLIFSEPATFERVVRVSREPRYWQQWYRQNIARVLSVDPDSAGNGGMNLGYPGTSRPKVHRDWSQDLGTGATVGAGNYPAKYAFRTNTAQCGSATTPDYVVFPTGLSGSATQASVVAYDNLYAGCGGIVPTVYWAYNTSGQVVTSPVISGDGTQVAFVQTNAALQGVLVLLKWRSPGGTVGSPVTPTTVATTAYRACTTPCMTTIVLRNNLGISTGDTTSSVFPDYTKDIIWVGGGSSWLHKITGVFRGNPAEATTGGFPAHLNTLNPNPLSSPVYDSVSGNIFVGDLGGFLYRVSATTGAVTQSGQVDHGTGLVAGPIVDSTAGRVYVFSSSDGTLNCIGGTAPCTAVYQFTTAFGAGTLGSKAVVGASVAFPPNPAPLYEGAFDNAYRTSANASGNLYVCGNTGGPPILYQIPIAASVMGTVVPGPVLSSVTTGCSPISDISNPNATGGTTEWIFAGTQASGTGNSCAAGGCIMNFKDQAWKPATAYAVGQEILDSHFQIQVVRVAGTSRATTPPAWNTVVDGSTTDNTVRWTNQGPLSASYATWLASHAYALRAEILDSNGNIQAVTAAGTSKAGAHPVWSTTINGQTTDNTVRWRNVGALGTASLPAAGGTSGIIIDNTVGSGTLAGASQVYFSTQSNQACGTSGTGGCAVQASQSALQ